MSDEVLIQEIRTAMRAEVAEIEVPPAVLTEVLGARSHTGPRVNLSWLGPALAVGVAAVVAVVAVTSLTHRGSPRRGVSASVPVTARGLAARLAVLRRPQTPADVLPEWAVRETESLTYNARVVGGLSRLVGAVRLGKYGRARVYLVVHRPPHFPIHAKFPATPQLSPRLGDQATIAFVGPFREEAAINGPTVAAGGETVAATAHGMTVDPGEFANLWGAVASIVPDGVTQVKWVFRTSASGRSGRRITVRPRVHDNVALSRLAGNPQVYLAQAVWYGADGRLISSFGVSSGPAVKGQSLKSGLNASRHETIAPVLPAHFALLRRAARDVPGLTRAQAAQLIEPNPLGLNVGRRRFVDHPLAALFVIPGHQGLALYVTHPFVGQAEGGISAALAGSLFVQVGQGSGSKTLIGLAPNGTRTVRVLLRNGASRTFPVVDNVYEVTVPPVPASAQTLILRNAAGRMVRIRLG